MTILWQIHDESSWESPLQIDQTYGYAIGCRHIMRWLKVHDKLKSFRTRFAVQIKDKTFYQNISFQLIKPS